MSALVTHGQVQSGHAASERPLRRPWLRLRAMQASALPQVKHAMPAALRVVLVVAGLALLVWPAWDLKRALWPINFLTPFFAVIVMGAVSVGLGLLGFGLFGESIHWTYAPQALRVHRRGWRHETVVRIDARDVQAIEVRRVENSEGADTWRVFVVPRAGLPGLGAAYPWLPAPRALESGDYATEEAANAGRDALLAHLG